MFLLSRLALRPWRLAPVSHLVSAVAVGFLLLLAGFLYWMNIGLRPVLARLQGEQVVTAYLDASVEAKDEAKIVDALRVSLGAHAQGPEVRFVSSQQFIENLRAPYPSLSRELEDLGPEMNAVVPRYVSVAGILSDQAVERIKSVPGIESVETSKNRYAHIVGAFLALRWVAKILMVGVLLALLTGLIHLSRMNAYLHREALLILKLWGASPAELRWPAMVSGALVGLAGGAGACAGWLLAGRWLAYQVRALSPMLGDMPISSVGIASSLLAGGLLIGVLAGALGGGVSPGDEEQAVAEAR